MPSAVCPASAALRGPAAATNRSGAAAGRVQTRARSICQCAPRWPRRLPSHRSRTISIASSSRSRRAPALRHGPNGCSLRRSPVPTPRNVRPSDSTAHVATAWATFTGWERSPSAVTPVPISIRSVAWSIAPSSDHTNGAWPWCGTHGCRWSLTIAVVTPAASAAWHWRTSSRGSCSSLDSHQPRRNGRSSITRGRRPAAGRAVRRERW